MIRPYGWQPETQGETQVLTTEDYIYKVVVLRKNMGMQIIITVYEIKTAKFFHLRPDGMLVYPSLEGAMRPYKSVDAAKSAAMAHYRRQPFFNSVNVCWVAEVLDMMRLRIPHYELDTPARKNAAVLSLEACNTACDLVRKQAKKILALPKGKRISHNSAIAHGYIRWKLLNRDPKRRETVGEILLFAKKMAEADSSMDELLEYATHIYIDDLPPHKPPEYPLVS